MKQRFEVEFEALTPIKREIFAGAIIDGLRERGYGQSGVGFVVTVQTLPKEEH